MREQIALSISLSIALAVSAPTSFAPTLFAPISFALRIQSSTPLEPKQQLKVAESAARDFAGIQNVVAFHSDFYSGSAPESEIGFQSLDSLGIKTILSVDGAIPEVNLAQKHGMRYVHLPIGYDGFDDVRKAQLVRAVRDLPKPIYLHCHHGKHRSAGAAGTVAVSLGWLTNDEALTLMKVCGTAAGYKGLWACTAAATPMTAIAIDAASNDFPQITKPDSFIASMVAIDETFDRLKLAEKNGWKAPQDHPDLAPISDAGKLADLFRLIGEPPTKSGHDADKIEMSAWFASDEKKANDLEKMIERPDAKQDEMSQVLSAITASCKQCHVKYRD